MNKKMPLVLTVLFFGLFLVNCSDSSSDDSESPSSSSLQADVSSSSSDDVPLSSSSQADMPSSSSDDTPSSSSQADVLSSSSDDTPPSSSSQVDVSSSSDDTPSSSSSDTPSSSSSLVEATLRAEPVAAAPANSPPHELYSWTDGNKNYYIIDAGYIKNSLLMENGFHYSGVGHIEITAMETRETSIAENRTNTVSNSIVVSTGSTNTTTNTIGLKEAITTGVTTSIEISGKTGFITNLFVKGSVKEGIETTIQGSIEKSTESSTTISKSFETSTGRTEGTSESFETTLKQSWTKSTSLAANSGDPAGYYRYAWYVISDVYFIISTSLNNQELLSWEVVSVPREKYELHQEYSPKVFDNSPIKGSEIVFAEDFYKKLPKPTDIISQRHTLTVNDAEGGNVSHNPKQIIYEAGTQVTVTATPSDGYVFNSWTGAPLGVNASSASITFAINNNLTLTPSFRKVIERRETKEFTTSGTFTFDKCISATIEVYALGAGGGGQGGHRMDAGIGKHYSGSGAAGGGGAAVYYKTTVDCSILLNINVGKGGAGGNGFRESGVGEWNSGYPGTDGGSTSVTWNNGSSGIIANGGKLGGGGDRKQGLDAGSGGSASSCDGCTSAPGESGTAGERGYSVDASKLASRGGNSGTISIGHTNPFGNGLGAERQSKEVITRLAGYGGGGFGGYNNTESGSNGGDGKVVIVVTYYE